LDCRIELIKLGRRILKKRHFADSEQRSPQGFLGFSHLSNFRGLNNFKHFNHFKNFQRGLITATIATIAIPMSLVIAPMARSQNTTSLNVTFVNNSNVELTSLQVAPANTRNWGANLLTSPTSSNTVNVAITDDRSDCNYDVRARFANGSVNEDFDVDFCQYDVYTFSSVPALW
jgi:hypothetical protein